jgi:hypothetical protein
VLLAKSGKILAATQTDFSPDGFRSSNPTTPASQSVSNALQMKVAHVIEGIGYGELHARLSLIWNLTGGQKKPIMHTQIIGSWRLAKIIS